jgi:hypothetical protein
MGRAIALMQQLTIQREEAQQRMAAEEEVRVRAAAAAMQAQNMARAAMTGAQLKVRNPAPLHREKLRRHWGL